METVIGVDLGTQSIKVLAYDPAAQAVVGEASHALELRATDDGTREQEASWWLDGFRACLASLPNEIRGAARAIGVSGQQHGFVALDAAGSVLAPVKLWCDTATVTECEEIIAAAGGDERCIELGGNAIAVGFTASKIRWLKRHLPEAYSRLDTVLLPHDYLNFRLTGRRTMEFGDASGTGVLDVRRRAWRPELIEAIDGDRDLTPCFPALIPAHEPAGTLTGQAAADLGLPPGLLVASGGGDNMMAAIGTGNVVEGRLTASLGTSGTLFGYAAEPVIDPESELSAFCSATGGWLPLLCTMNCTVATEQLRDLFELTVSEIESLAASVPPGADGVVTLPFYNGERTPALPDGKAVVFGLDMENTTRAHLLRSAMEAAIYGLKAGLAAFQRCGIHYDEVTVTGGGAASGLWRQICADVLDMPVRVPAQEENAAFGAAIQALWCHRTREGGSQPARELERLVEEHVEDDPAKRCTPSSPAVAIYAERYDHYLRLVDTVRPVYS